MKQISLTCLLVNLAISFAVGQAGSCEAISSRNLFSATNETLQLFDFSKSHSAGFIFSGTTGEENPKRQSGVVIKSYHNAEIQWSKKLSGITDLILRRTLELETGDVIVGGTGKTNTPDQQPLYVLLKMDRNGNLIWHQSYSSGSNSEIQSFTLTDIKYDTRGRLYCIGTARSASGEQDGLLFSVSASGDLLQSRRFINNHTSLNSLIGFDIEDQELIIWGYSEYDENKGLDSRRFYWIRLLTEDFLQTEGRAYCFQALKGTPGSTVGFSMEPNLFGAFKTTTGWVVAGMPGEGGTTDRAIAYLQFDRQLHLVTSWHLKKEGNILKGNNNDFFVDRHNKLYLLSYYPHAGNSVVYYSKFDENGVALFQRQRNIGNPRLVLPLGGRRIAGDENELQCLYHLYNNNVPTAEFTNISFDNIPDNCMGEEVRYGNTGPFETYEDEVPLFEQNTGFLSVNASQIAVTEYPLQKETACQVQAACNSVSLEGVQKYCDASQTVKYIGHRPPGCKAALQWTYDEEKVHSLSFDNDSTISVRWRLPAQSSQKTKIFSGITSCPSAIDSMEIELFAALCGCTITDDIAVNIHPCNQVIYFPGAFSPNGDGRNDQFKPISTMPPSRYELSIYNRLGQLVFHTKNINHSWDGKINGKLQATGLFVWVCRYSFPGAKTAQQKGTVYLVP